ncbi:MULTISPECIES: chemotaxis signal transducer protein Htr8 [Halobacterium]|uniref:Transducer protein Htr8 n=4 Tax=Halobacterium salinarum TaxID=2242 RepID=HTR8_HALS3|nr:MULTISPECIES: chemotaxis signal transducer protein Htr8 [Halobacterium]B0R5T0.1 RecName: Full=Transducer protein Htr8 [Halobacterium salinarum R1]AAG19812.1 Htr8 transducer [Halobacterium salinarum NRC-1]MBB6088817.1 methyl-accepting chemotaxis protein [Halobacterium salinarum]MCF2166027.1 methyl-accepting chemotaxis protein [Halobacterium salinarum]MCF2167547.1 methyl-accepting chemotaxis protein [Halobacterium salinarum]MDL0121672.1 chemotaxis signal transducer protein Htr8 [Halobacteriu
MGESARGGGSAETTGGLAAAVKTYLEYTPTGESIPAAAWRRRHRNVRVFVLAHIPLLLALGLYEGTESAVTGATIPPTPGILIAAELGIVGALVGLASIPSVSRRGRTALASTAVLASSVVLVQFSGGFIEAHFHFFVGMAVIAVYEDWLPFALGLVYVVFTHGVFGMINAERVYNHTAAINNPWVWGGIHGAFVLLLAGALMANWYSTERSREASQKRLEEARQKAQQVEDLEARQAEIEAEKAEAKRLKADAEEAREAAEAQQREVAALNERLEATANTYGAAMARAADGDLSVRLDPDVENDAMAAIAASFNEMLDETETTIREIQAVASDVAAASEDADAGVVEIEDASGQVSETVQEIAAGADEQREKLETVSGEMTDLSAAIEEVAASADSVAERSHETAAVAGDGEQTAEQAIADSRTVQSAVESTVQNVEALDDQLAEISEIVDLISDVAEQTNMLALNANIEAARADKSGDGFAVVADEVKDLAEETRASAGDIEALVADIDAQMQATVTEARTADESVQDAISAVDAVVDAFGTVAENAEETDTGVQEISTTTDDQAASTEEAVSMIAEVSDISTATAADAQQASTAAEQQTTAAATISENTAALREQADRLQGLVSTFDVHDESASTAARSE